MSMTWKGIFGLLPVYFFSKFFVISIIHRFFFPLSPFCFSFYQLVLLQSCHDTVCLSRLYDEFSWFFCRLSLIFGYSFIHLFLIGCWPWSLEIFILSYIHT
ncbi:hypothetical protein DFH27DRAFT_570737 [Peziza echinospora]|nr:hypothetical protein DFH27DRAFT_570737 [Peziza echinospora]